MKSTDESIERSEELLKECLEKIPGLVLRNRAVTTSSIYCKTPDGYSLRIGDHKGREKYSYKWNLDPRIKGKGYWKKVYNAIDRRKYWRFYSGSVDEIAAGIASNIEHAKANES